GGQRQRRHPPDALLRYVQGLPTGQENTNPGAVPQDRLTQLCQRADRALAGVQEQQCALCPQSGDDRLGRGAPTVLHRVQTVGDRPQDLVVGGGLTQIDEACTVRKTTQDTLGHVQGQAGLADSPRTGQCDHPGTAQGTSQVDDVAFTTDEPDALTGGQGQVVARAEPGLGCWGTGGTRRGALVGGAGRLWAPRGVASSPRMRDAWAVEWRGPRVRRPLLPGARVRAHAITVLVEGWGPHEGEASLRRVLARPTYLSGGVE